MDLDTLNYGGLGPHPRGGGREVSYYEVNISLCYLGPCRKHHDTPTKNAIKSAGSETSTGFPPSGGTLSDSEVLGHHACVRPQKATGKP